MSDKGQRKTIFQTALTDTSSTDIEGVGTIREVGGKKYVWAQYDNGAEDLTPAAGDAVGLSSVTYNSDGSIATLVVSDDVSGCKWGVGVLLAVPTDQYYCWVQIGGMTGSLTVNATGSPSVGNALALSGTNKAFAKAAADTDVVIGALYDATGSANKAVLYGLTLW